MKSLVGLDKLFDRLDKVENSANIIQGLQRASIRVETEAKENAPVDDGTLRASITHEIDPAALVAEVGTNVEYAPYVEFGTGIFAANGDGRKTPWTYQDAEGKWITTAGQHPQPFLVPALERNIEKIKADIANAMKEGIKK